jgi:hypothetical protein
MRYGIADDGCVMWRGMEESHIWACIASLAGCEGRTRCWSLGELEVGWVGSSASSEPGKPGVPSDEACACPEGA